MTSLNHLSRSTPAENPLNQQFEEERVQITSERKVRFNDKVRRRKVKYIPKQDHENIWYTREDYEEAYSREDALRECISANKALYAKNADNLDAQAVLTEKQLWTRRMAAEASIVTVLVEQERQEEEFFRPDKNGDFALDIDKIAEAYSIQSQDSIREAQSRATRLQRHLQDIANKSYDDSSVISPIRLMRKRAPTRRSLRSRASFVQKLDIPRPSVLGPKGSPEVCTCAPRAA